MPNMRPRKLNKPMKPSKAVGPILKFSSRTDAFDFVNERATRPLRVMLGDDNKFWIVTPADAAQLERQGFEYAR